MMLRLQVVPPDEETLAKNFGNYMVTLQVLDQFIVAKMYDTFCQMTAVYAGYMNDLNAAAAAKRNRIQRNIEEGELSVATLKYERVILKFSKRFANSIIYTAKVYISTPSSPSLNSIHICSIVLIM